MIEEENKKEYCCGTQANTTMSSTTNVAVVTSTGDVWGFINLGGGKLTKQKHKYIPEAIYCNLVDRVTMVKWSDGTETKVTCDKEDNFTPESGFFAALAIKVFGNDKKKFKDFWFPVVSRRIFVDGKKVTPLKYGKWEAQRKAELAKRKAKKENLNAKAKAKV